MDKEQRRKGGTPAPRGVTTPVMAKPESRPRLEGRTIEIPDKLLTPT